MVTPVNPMQILVDVIALSQKLCNSPILGNLAYATNENFLGRIVNGYNPDAHEVCLLTKKVAHALCDVQIELNSKNLGLLIYDAYRPLRAVKDFANWFNQPVANNIELRRKAIHYPNIQKTELVVKGYAPDLLSRHNFGNAVDLTLINLHNMQTLDMGACFDYFDELSHLNVNVDKIGREAHNNRLLLATIMNKNNFLSYEYEFWHFDYILKEVAKPIDIPITKDLKGLNIN